MRHNRATALAAPLELRPDGYSCKPVLLIGLPSNTEWANCLSHILIHDILYATTSTFMDGIHRYEPQLQHLSSLDGKELLHITRKYGGSIIWPIEEVILDGQTEVDKNRLRQLQKGDYQAVIVDDTCFIREPDITNFVVDQYTKGASVVVMAMEGIFDISLLNRKFNVDWKFLAYTSNTIELTDRGKAIIGDAFLFEERRVKANFICGKGELFTEHQDSEVDYDDVEEYPYGPPPPSGSPIVTALRDHKSVSYFGFVNPLDVSYSAILLKLCYATGSTTSGSDTTASSKNAALSIEFVRLMAQQYGYTEVCHNETSCMISFRKDANRINVYYTTATVGTCLNHPRSGKTQLFRRNVDGATLVSIFANPRVHTGTGYYHRKNMTQKWKLKGANNVFLSDSARRWQYVGETTGLLTDENEMQTVIDIVTEWDSLYWNDGELPHMNETNFACGSHGGLVRMMYQVVRETCGDFQCWSHSSNKFYSGGEMPYNHKCDNLRRFLEVHRVDVRRIKEKLKSLSRTVLVELMQWLIGREVCAMRLVNMNGERFMTEWSSLVMNAHQDYGEIMYPRNAPVCRCCGIMETTGEVR